MTEMRFTHETATDLFGDAYMVERREFSDGDHRTVIKHNYGWSAYCYVQVLVWVEKAEVWVEYHEHDTRRCRTVMEYEEFDPDADPMEYVAPL